MNKTIGIIGFGNMGRAIAERVKVGSSFGQEIKLFKIIVFDKDRSKIVNADKLDIASDIKELMKKSEALMLAVKPQDFDVVLDEVKKHLDGHLIISIAAGVTTSYIETRLGGNVHVIRAMPNMPAQIGEGVSGLCKGKFANEEDFGFALELFRCVGFVIDLDNERMIDVITAISGSGPAFYCYYIQKGGDPASREQKFIDELTNIGKDFGFDLVKAKHIATQTAAGSAALLKKNSWTCEELIKRVASKGGTTEAGLEVLRKGKSLEEAVQAAKKRAEELSKKG